MFINKIKTLALCFAAILCVAVIAGVHLPFNTVKALTISEDDANNKAVKDNKTIDVLLNYRGAQMNYTVQPTDCASILDMAGVSLEKEDVLNVPETAFLSENTVINLDKVEYRTETRQQTVPFETIENGIDTIPKGTREVVSEGKNGLAICTYLVKYVNGEAVEEALYTSETVSESVNEVVNVGVGGTVTANDGTVYNYSYRKQMEATAYTYMPPYTGMITATGETLRKGIVAVDPKVIPMHTKMFITGSVEYGLGVAEDTGGAIKGNIVDLAYMSYDECIQFGRRQMQVYILED